MTVGTPEFQGTPRFKLLRRLGRGGAGVVYEALDREQSTRVALKLLHTMGPEELLRFKNEFRLVQDLAHPNLVGLGELIEESGQWFYTMEFVDGVDLLRWVRHPQHFGEESQTPTAPLRIVSHAPSAPAPPPPPAGGARPRFDEARLRAALVQLVQGLSTLHAAGKIHRDVKPSNILVAPDGRVVILDFGLVQDVERPAHVTRTGHVVGTAHYMAPEQAAGLAIGPPADWYAVGVMLYQALVGRLPFSGDDAKVLSEKQEIDPPRAADLAAHVPPDLDALCAALLTRDPERRPSGQSLLQKLTAGAPAGERSPGPGRGAPFVGRVAELAALTLAFDESRRGKPAAVYILGESGIGKSALAAHFAADAASRHGAVCLSGRCYDRESVPYKAFDGVVDALARYMAELPGVEAAALLPLHAALLTRVFPVLRRVEAIAKAPPHPRPLADPKELRTQVFAAIRELFTRLAMRWPLVLVIDDLQWTDADSLALLQFVLQPPDPPALLILATVRMSPDAAGRSTSLLDLDAALPGDVRRVLLERLPAEDARALAAALIREVSADRVAEAEAIAREADGHPLFINELVRTAPADGARTQLEEVLRARIEDLPDAQRSLVELVAVAGGPIAQETVAQAAQIDFAEFGRHVAALRSKNLVRASGVRRSDGIEPYHDRVRSAALLHMSEASRRRWHERLALALEITGDAETRAFHWRAAGRLDWAARHALEAAQLAEQALAFDRAARLYRLVLELGPPEGIEVHTLQVRLADTLANGGLSHEAALVYLAAAEHAPHAEALELRGKAGGQCLVGGYLDEGLKVYEDVLAELGMRLAPRGRRAIPALLWRRLQLRLRGLSYRERTAHELSAAELQRLDMGYKISSGLIVDPIRASHFHTVHLLLALRAGEPARVARALCGEMIYQASLGRGDRRTEELVALARQLAEKTGDPHALALVLGGAGLAAYVQGRWRSARDGAERALRLFREKCTGVTWEVMQCEIFTLRCLYFLGEIKEISRRLPRALQEARTLGNLYGASQLPAGEMVIHNLARDDIEGARAEAAEAFANWSQEGIHLIHHIELLGRAHIDLYAGQARMALQHVHERWDDLQRAQLWRVQILRVLIHDLRGRCALAAAIAGGADRVALLDDAGRCARRLSREKRTWADGLGKLLRAGIAAARGDVEDALAVLDLAIDRFTRASMVLHAAAARRRKGELLGGSAGRELVEAADAWLSAQGIRKPERIVAILAPGA